jgi:P pilus assembly chaperone PapD
MSKKSRSKQNVARLVAGLAILGLVFAVAAPAMIILSSSQLQTHNADPTQEVTVESLELESSIEVTPEIDSESPENPDETEEEELETVEVELSSEPILRRP